MNSQKKKIAKNQKSMTRYLGDFANPRRPHEEVKSFSLGALSQAVYDGVAGQFLVDLTAVTQGVSGAQRVGDHLYAQHLRMMFTLTNGSGATSNLQVVWRIFVFQYLGDSAVAAKPIISDFLQTNPANAGTTYGAFSNYDIDYDRQYVMLYDSLGIQTTGNHGLAVVSGTEMGEYKHVDKVVSLARADRNISYYTGSTAGPNHIFLLVTTDSANITVNPIFSYSSEFRFTDS
jgi:hypothetical protein